MLIVTVLSIILDNALCCTAGRVISVFVGEVTADVPHSILQRGLDDNRGSAGVEHCKRQAAEHSRAIFLRLLADLRRHFALNKLDRNIIHHSHHHMYQKVNALNG